MATRTETILTLMIEKQRELSIVDEKRRNVYPLESFYKEFKTIRLQLPRQSGQTTSVLKVVNDYYKKPVYVVNGLQMVNFVEKQLQNPHKIMCRTFSNIVKNKGVLGQSIDAVIIDNVSLLSKEEIDQLYTAMIIHRPEIFILIG